MNEKDVADYHECIDLLEKFQDRLGYNMLQSLSPRKRMKLVRLLLPGLRSLKDILEGRDE